MPSDNVFNFVSVRPPQKLSPQHFQQLFTRYHESVQSPLHRSILELKEGENKRAKAVELALAYLESDEYMPDASNLIDAVRIALTAESVSDAKAVIEEQLNTPLEDFLAGEATAALRDRLWDSLYAQTLAPNQRPDDRDGIYAGIRALHYIQLLHDMADNSTPMSRQELEVVSPLVPKSVVPLAPTIDGLPGSKELSEWVTEQLDNLEVELIRLDGAVTDIRDNHRIYTARELQKFGFEIEDDISETPDSTKIKPITLVPYNKPFILDSGPLPIFSLQAERREQGQELVLVNRQLSLPAKTPWILDAFGNERLKDSTKALVESYRLEIEEAEVAEVVSVLQGKKLELARSFWNLLPTQAIPIVMRSEKFSAITSRVQIPFSQIAPTGQMLIPIPEPEPEPGSAAARGIRPLGIGDLLVVRQELLRYVAGEVAHIENILKSEYKKRVHTRIRETEDIIIVETEEMEESEKDLQSTERFELQTEIQKTIETEMKLEAGVSVTGSYGMVSVTAHADFALNQSRSQSSRSASSFAKEVTERSLSRIMQRTREERTRRTLERFEETNEHGFDNSDGDGHVIGIYRWVDKYYKARIVNYGKRLMLEFVVPEPAAFFLHTQNNQSLSGVTLEKPKPPMVWGRKLEASDLDRWNYMDFVSEYNVQNVEPYPAETIKVAAAFGEVVNPNSNANFAKTSEKLVVPDGYKAYGVYGWTNMSGYDGDYASVYIGGEQFSSVTASGLRGIIPISVSGWTAAFQVNVVAKCELTDEARKRWQLETYSKIMNTYERQLADYYEQVAAAQIQSGVQIEGRNPGINRKIEQDELRKGVLRSLTNNFTKTRVGGAWYYYEYFSSMQDDGAFGYPEFDVDEAIHEGKIIQFFEQAFEWNNMTYRFYPYFWGRKAKWKEIFPLDDPDPQFTDFLRAGSARVNVPVQPLYEETLLHYLYTNEIWNGGEPPTLDDPLYISIVDEIRSDSGADLDGELPICSDNTDYPCIVDEWEVKLPTSLVYLQTDSVLPDFTMENIDHGEFVQVPDHVPPPRLEVGGRGRINPNNDLALRIRETPGLNGRVITAWAGGVEFTVQNGPRLMDDYLWWQVDNGTVIGWCAEGIADYYYLEPIEE